MPSKEKVASSVQKRFDAVRPLVKQRIANFLSEHPDIYCTRADITDMRGVWHISLDVSYQHREGKDDHRKVGSSSRGCRWPLTDDEVAIIASFAQSLTEGIDDLETPELEEEREGIYTYRLYLTGSAPQR